MKLIFFFTLVVFVLLIMFFLSGLSSFLMSLVILEVFMFCSFITFMEVFSVYHLDGGFLLSLMFLVMMIFEGVFGLCLMLLLVRNDGNENFLM